MVIAQPFSQASRPAQYERDDDAFGGNDANLKRNATQEVSDGPLRIAVLHAFPRSRKRGASSTFSSSHAKAHDTAAAVDAVEDEHFDDGSGGGRSRVASERTPILKLEEAVSLAEAAGFTVVADDIAALTTVSAATFLGSGKVAQLRQLIKDSGADAVFINAALSAVQQRNLSRSLGLPSDCVLDRVAVILHIFGRRARTREAKMQVQLAQLRHARSRLVAGSTNAVSNRPPSLLDGDGLDVDSSNAAVNNGRARVRLSQQRGGIGVMSGAGETQLELDKRRLDDEIRRLEKGIDDVSRTRALHRSARAKAGLLTVALVGYTNVGKSALASALTRSGKFRVKNQLFATLDSSTRGMDLPSGKRCLLVDTVGFVTDLPHALVASFRATLEEVVAADVLVHVRDVSHPEAEGQKGDVASVLSQMGLDYGAMMAQGRLLEVWNKVDRLLLPLPDGEGAAVADVGPHVQRFKAQWATYSDCDGSPSAPAVSIEGASTDSNSDAGQSPEQAALLAAVQRRLSELRQGQHLPSSSSSNAIEYGSWLPPNPPRWPAPASATTSSSRGGGSAGDYARRRPRWDDSSSDDGGATEGEGAWGQPQSLHQFISDSGKAASAIESGEEDEKGNGYPAATSAAHALSRPTLTPVLAVSARTGVGLRDLLTELDRRLGIGGSSMRGATAAGRR